jgi:flavodoxin
MAGDGSAVKALIVYESKYGNTKLVGETVAQGMMETEGVEATLLEAQEVDLSKAADCDLILIGSPNHIGGLTRGIMKFIDELGKVDLKGKWVAVFDTYMGGDFEKAVKKMEKRIGEKAPGLKIAAQGLSVRVQGMKGPVVEGELPRSKEFGSRILAQVGETRNPAI